MLTRPLRRLLLAVHAYSRLPMPGRARAWAGDDPAEHARAASWLPFVGLAIALPASLVYAFCGLWLPHAVAVLAAMLAMLLLGGTVHERALAHWVDGAGPGRRGIGAPAGIALVLLVLARLELLSTIDPTWLALTLVCAAAFSRGCAVLVGVTLPAAQVQAPAQAGRQRPPGPRTLDAGWAIAWAIAPSAGAAAWTRGPAVFVTAAAIAVLASAWMRRRIHQRPAALEHAPGAVQAIAEIAFLVGMVASLSAADAGLEDTLW